MYLARIILKRLSHILILFLAYPVVANQDQAKIKMVIGQVKQYCGSCHTAPHPSLMPKRSWPTAINAMVQLANDQFKTEYIPKDALRNINAYYYGTAPKELPRLPIYSPAASPKFDNTTIGFTSSMPLVVNIQPAGKLIDSPLPQFLVCDSEKDTVSLLFGSDKHGWNERVIANIKSPSRAKVIDIDNDGYQDVLVSVLGILPPSPQLSGKVILLRQTKTGQFIQETLLDEVGRVTDASVADLDGDNDLDIAVAVFGGGPIGEVLWLEKSGDKYIKHILTGLSGALNVSITDINKDGKLDILSLISQEHEMISAFLNRGNGKFQQATLAKAPHPMYGSTSMTLADLDGDDDQDIIFTNGDAHDTQMDPKPYHGIQWLENKGNLKFQFHNLGRFYGAVSAIPADLDGDGDLDVVASSWLNYWQNESRQSIIWFENDGKQNFERHNITNRPASVVSFAVQDLTHDDKPDIIFGTFKIDDLLAKLTGKTPTHAEKQTLNAKERFFVLKNNL